MLNLKWNELVPCWSGVKDAPTAGKRRYEGALPVEEAHHYHSNFGPFCAEVCLPCTGNETFGEFLNDVLRPNLMSWLKDFDAQGTCQVCAFMLANAFLNVIYWHNQRDVAPAAVGRWHRIAR